MDFVGEWPTDLNVLFESEKLQDSFLSTNCNPDILPAIQHEYKHCLS